MKCLDNGYVELVECWGSDERIIEAARMSTGKGFNGWGPKPCKCITPSVTTPDSATTKFVPLADCKKCKGSGRVPGDEKLLHYLYYHKHMTPFEMCGATFEIKAPIFVFREWHRHRTQSYNEMSARYTPLPNENYSPSYERCLNFDTANKQATPVGDKQLSDVNFSTWLTILHESYKRAQEAYDYALSVGVPKELARISVPVSRYSKMRASANLRNWLHFLTLRMDSAAQYEIRVYAQSVGEYISRLFPRTWELFSGE